MRLECPARRCREEVALLEVRQEEVHFESISADKAAGVFGVAEIVRTRYPWRWHHQIEAAESQCQDHRAKPTPHAPIHGPGVMSAPEIRPLESSMTRICDMPC
jgi:hypothetical protein